MNRNFLLISLFTLLILLSSFSELGSHRYKIRVIVIDAGHGGKDPGCSGKKNKESIIALKIALELGKTIEEHMPDVKVIYTRKTDVFVDLQERAAIANRNQADIFISIHCNAGPKHIFGTETYTMGVHSSKANLDVAKRENSVILKETNYLKKYDGFDPKSPVAHIFFANVQSTHMDNSLRLADKIEHQFSTRANRTSRGVKQAGFLVLWKTSMPSVLIETGYLSHKEDEKYLADEIGQVYTASSIYRALRDYKQEIEN